MLTALAERGKGEYIPVPDLSPIILSQESQDSFIEADSGTEAQEVLTARQQRQGLRFHFDVVCTAFSELLLL